jgi:hypothetical protein
MTVTRRLMCVGLLCLTAVVGGASAASASVFYVSTAGNDANSCTSPAAACQTIREAIVKSESAPDSSTIELAPGTYKGVVKIRSADDNGLTINGAGSGAGGSTIESAAKENEHPTIEISFFGAPIAVALSNLKVLNSTEGEKPVIESAGYTTLTNVSVDTRSTKATNGISQGPPGSLTFNGGSVTMETGNEGSAIAAQEAPASLSGVQLNEAEGANGVLFGIALAPAEFNGVTVHAGKTNTNPAVDFAFAAVKANGLSVTMEDAASTANAVVQDYGSGAYEGLQVGGTWNGAALEVFGAPATVRDSAITTTSNAHSGIRAYEDGEGPGLFLQRSVVHSLGTAAPVFDTDSNVTLDSSELLGGNQSLAAEQGTNKTHTITIASSTLDAGNLGERDSAGMVGGLFLLTEAPPSAELRANIEGSILLEPSHAFDISGHSNIQCIDSDVPSQSQAEAGEKGTIGCAAGSNGNTDTAPAALFSAPIGSYQLNPASAAIDSVPAGAIALPFGLAPSATDLGGSPRVLNGNGGCPAVQDRGALELQGHAGACPLPSGPPPGPAPAKPTLGVISGLSLSPSSFAAGPSGATISSAKAKYGTLVSYRDSQAATAVFTVLRVSTGRKQAGSCHKPSKANRKGRPCTLLVALASFSHSDAAGAEHFHFSGRLKGKKLAKGTYRLQAVPRNPAGIGKAVVHSFTIK